MSSIKNSVKVVKLLCNIYECRNDGWISLSVLRGAISNRQNRDVDVNIYIPNILFCESVDFNSGAEVQYLGMETEEENDESRAYRTGYTELEELIRDNESYCIITIPENYFQEFLINNKNYY